MNITSWENVNWRELKINLFEKQKEIYLLKKKYQTNARKTRKTYQFLQCKTLSCLKSHSRKPRKKNCRSWWNKKTQWNKANRTCEKNSNRRTILKNTTNMNRKTWEERKKTIGNSNNKRSSKASLNVICTKTWMGGNFFCKML